MTKTFQYKFPQHGRETNVLLQDEWDAESEDEKPKVAAAPPPPKPKKSVKQAIAEREERERKEAEEKAARRVYHREFAFLIL